MRFGQFALAFILILCSASIIRTQVTITNLAESQFGKLPNETADEFPSIYDRTEINFRKKGFSVASTLEQYYTTTDGRSYFDLSQFTLGFKKKKWDIKLGNFYETLGRGLLLRSYEIPGALLEDLGFRSRYYFHRDLLGASVKFRSKRATFQVLRADALNNVLPPTFGRTERRTDLVTAVSAKVKIAKAHDAGMTLMTLEQSNGNDASFLSSHINGSVVQGLDYYTEYAVNLDEGDYAIYAGLTGYKDAFSFSVEYKKYNNFVLGSGINEPPAGVKQQTYRVLNRSIHIPNPLNEEGYQLDMFYHFDERSVLNFNHSLAVNSFGGKTTTFRQFFIELQSSLGELIEYKAFVDFSQDPFKGESDRFSMGLYPDIGISEHVRLTPEIEYQTFKRNDQSLYNFNMLAGINIKSRFFLSVLGEWTNDPFIVRENQSSRLYLGGAVRYKPSYKHTVQLFIGQRRGGPQCSAGVCYEILDFRGVELRWISRFIVK